MLQPIINSGPTLQWWMSLDASQQAGWVSAIGSFAAALIALTLARRAEENSKKERVDLAKVFAPAVVQELRLIRYHCDQIEIIDRDNNQPNSIKWQKYRDNLASLDVQTLTLVASRDIYRDVAGQSLMALYGEVLRVIKERERWSNDEVADKPEAFYLIAGGKQVSAAKMLRAQAEDALKNLWPMTSRGKELIPPAIDPYS